MKSYSDRQLCVDDVDEASFPSQLFDERLPVQSLAAVVTVVLARVSDQLHCYDITNALTALELV
jgi:hypothetical protein